MSGSGIADVSGAGIAWWAQGEGSAIVLNHAGVADARMWEPLVPTLPTGYRVVRYDMRGFGRTRAAAGTFSPSRDLAGLPPPRLRSATATSPISRPWPSGCSPACRARACIASWTQAI